MSRSAIAVSLISLWGCAPANVWHATSPVNGVRVQVRQSRAGACMTVGAGAERCFDAISLASLSFASDGDAIAYAARLGGKWFVVHVDDMSAGWEGVGTPVLSPDGTRVAFPVSDGGSWRVVVDGSAGPAFDSMLPGSLIFDRSGRRFAYAARIGDSVVVVVDGAAGPRWTGVGQLTFSWNGSSVAYAAMDQGAARLVMHHVPLATHYAIGSIVAARARDDFWYAARSEDGWYVHAGALRYGPYDTVRTLVRHQEGSTESPLFIAGSPHGEQVTGGVSSERSYRQVNELVLSPSGRHWGYIADAATVVIDGNAVANEELASDLSLSNIGSYVYLAARGERAAVVHSGKEHRFDLVIPGTLQFIDGSRWACVAGDSGSRRLFIVVDGRRTSRSLDWRNIVWLVQRGNAALELRRLIAAEARLALTDSTR